MGSGLAGDENECRWHALMAIVEAEPLPLAEFLLGVVFAVLAIVVKLEITAGCNPSQRRLRRMSQTQRITSLRSRCNHVSENRFRLRFSSRFLPN